MATFDYNPITGQLDLVGGGASYIDGEVEYHSNLPVTVGSPAVNSAFLVRKGEGLYFISRKPAGIWVRELNNGNLDDWKFAGLFSDLYRDANFRIISDSDVSKELAFSLSGITTGSTRTLTVPNASGRIQVEGQPIGNVTAAAGTFTTLTAAPTSGSALTLTGGTVTAPAPLISATQTWNNSAVTFTGLAANITNTASATASLVARLTVGSTNVFEVDGRGFTKFRKVATSADLVTMVEVLRGTTSVVRIRDDGDVSANSFAVTTGGRVILDTNGVGIQSTARFGISSSASASATDCDLNRDAADTFAQRRGTNAQTFRIYNTFTDAVNYERGFMRWNSSIFQIGTEKVGTGSRRTLEFVTDGTARWRVGDGSISSNPSMLALGNTAIFGANEAYNVIIATGGQGTTNAGVFSPNASNTGYLAIGESLHLGLLNNGSSGDVRLVRDAANVLALRNGANTPQAYRIYNTFTSTTNFERLNIAAQTGGNFIIGTEKGSGGGTARSLELRTDNTARLTIGSAGTVTLNTTLAADAQNISTDTTTGTKIGTATSQKIGFFNATPAVQPAAVADATDAASTQDRLNDLLARLRTLGLIAT